MKNIFHLNINAPYNLTSRSELYRRNPETYGTETISYLAPKIWSLVPNAIKSSKSLDALVAYIRITCNMSVSSSFSLLNFSKELQT